MGRLARASFNGHQQHRLIVTCQHIDRLLRHAEQALVEAQSNSPFRRFVSDLAPAERRLVTDYIVRVRTELVRVLNGQGLSPESHQVGLRHSVLTHLGSWRSPSRN